MSVEVRSQRRQLPVVEDRKLDTGEAFEEACIASIAARKRQRVEQTWYAIIEHRSIVTACLVFERSGKPTLAGAGRDSVTMPGVRRSRF
jgi:hypothetical protein